VTDQRNPPAPASQLRWGAALPAEDPHAATAYRRRQYAFDLGRELDPPSERPAR
jgi:hypothetical protein